MKDTERELKILLTKEQYEKLRDLLPEAVCREQTNTYYDTADGLLKFHGFALRIRDVNGKHIMTVKKPMDSITKYEFEQVVSAGRFDDLPASEQQWGFEKLGLGQIELKPFISLTTLRCMKKTDQAEICLDRTTFAHHTDYELEYEYTKDHDGISVFNELLSKVGLHYEKNCPSKLARAVIDSVE